MRHFAIKVIACFLWALSVPLLAVENESTATDALLSELKPLLGSSPEKAELILEKLKAQESGFTQTQRETYLLAQASSMGLRGDHAKRIALAQSALEQVKTPILRARFLYELIDGNTALGHYETALKGMNESILLLPALDKVSQKIVVLQGATALLESLHAYDDALVLAERIYALHKDVGRSNAACIGLTDKVELNFMRGDRAMARSLVPDAIQACEANKNQLVALIAKTLAVIDLIDSEQYPKGITAGLPLLAEFSVLSQGSDYVPQLQEALARAYLKTGNLERAEHFGLRAFQRAQAARILLLQEKTSETMAAIKLAQGQLAAAIGYYDINLALKKRVLDDQVQKNLAYQRVKFDTQDKANQLALLEQKNQNLRMERTLQERQYENLILMMTLGLILLAIMGTWLVRTIGKMDAFRQSAQVDELTQVSNRAYFTSCAQQVFRNTRQTQSLVLFDMDYFKHVNDTFGHATGDWVLKTVCDTVKAHLRKTDLFGRMGGEEFALCMSGASPEEVLALAERCRLAILSTDTRPSGHEFAIASSFGIATRGVGESDSFKDMLAAADKALYVSKNTGRNRVSVYRTSNANEP